MSILVGIDEAGYGPILGPLVVSAAMFEMPDELLTASLWDVLRTSVAKTRGGSRGRVVVADSKKLHRGLGQYQDLQRGVLAFLAGSEPSYHLRHLGDLLAAVGINDADAATTCQWYTDHENAPIPLVDAEDLSLAGQALRNDMVQRGVVFHGLRCRILHPGRFNELVSKINNKASVLFGVAAELIDDACCRFPNTDMQFVIDKHGGRDHYREQLGRLFEGFPLKILREDERVSSYEIQTSQRIIKIHFLAGGDDRQLPIALASMAGKYLRELHMEQFNAYFGRTYPNLKPTAGYYQDGMRFLNDLSAAGYDVNGSGKHHMVRTR
ncbi:MAG: hypothetical protein JW709_06955 [Sedimentisphaerales bacterium]|nr:hypothetical protein [Sedimentisphaerales bacterium]